MSYHDNLEHGGNECVQFLMIGSSFFFRANDVATSETVPDLALFHAQKGTLYCIYGPLKLEISRP
jgi:hypothetical protein